MQSVFVSSDSLSVLSFCNWKFLLPKEISPAFLRNCLKSLILEAALLSPCLSCLVYEQKMYLSLWSPAKLPYQMFMQPFEDIKHHVNAKQWCYCHQLPGCSCSSESFSAGGCTVVLGAVVLNPGGAEGGGMQCWCSPGRGAGCGRAEMAEAVLPDMKCL